MDITNVQIILTGGVAKLLLEVLIVGLLVVVPFTFIKNEVR
jgi:hypothetical protein